MKTFLLAAISMLLCLPSAGAINRQMPATNHQPMSAEATPADTTVMTFKFVPGQDMFYIPWAGNGTQLEKLYTLLDKHRSEITSGQMPVYVDGYCTSHPTATENLRTAYLRANRVKSELITQKGLKEADFITANHATAYKNEKDVVLVTLRIPTKEADAARSEQERREQAERERQAQAERKAQAERERTQAEAERAEREREQAEKAEAERLAREQTGADAAQPHTKSGKPAKPYCLAVRTNLLYDAFLLPTLGLEWRVSNSVGIKFDGSLSRWGGPTGKVQKMWMLNPEVRWYLLDNKRLYAGVSGNYGEYNLYKYMLGGILSKDTGYQGKLWNAGLTVGYQLPLSRHFAVDFNLGLGYTRSEHDSFGLVDGVRVYKERNHTKNFWGPTQAGISLLWTIGKE